MIREEDLQKFCMGLVAQFRASGSAVFLVEANSNTVIPGILCDMPTMKSIAHTALQQGHVPANTPSLDGMCDEVCSYFGCSCAMVLVMFHEQRTVYCSSNCPPEISLNIMQNLVAQPAEA